MTFALIILSAIAANSTGAVETNADAKAGETSETPAELVYRQSFDAADDVDFDGFPDGWRRETGRRYPHYVKIGIVRDADPAAVAAGRANYLQVDLDGGAAAIYSPPIRIDPQFSFRLETQISASGLTHDRAFVSIAFLDENRQPLGARHDAAPVTRTEGWRPMSIAPNASSPDDARWVIIGLHVEPTERADLSGRVRFDSIQLLRLPRMTILANRPQLVFEADEKITITCRASGIGDAHPRFEAELLDAEGNRLAAETLTPRASVSESEGDLAENSRQGERRVSASSAYSAVADWNAPVSAPGLYRVRIAMNAASGQTLTREVQFVRLAAAAGATTGEFGWSLADLYPEDKLGALAALVGQTGVGLVKLPVWYSPGDTAAIDRAAWFAERVGVRGAKVIGVLDRPPLAAREQFGGDGPLPVATVFHEPKLWRPLIDPVMTRLSLKIESWQLGADNDESFVDYPDLDKKIAEIKSNLEQYGQEADLGFMWPWLREPPALAATSPASGSPVPTGSAPISLQRLSPWSFLCLTDEPAFTAEELDSYLAVREDFDSTNAARWLSLRPLPKSIYAHETRARDLVERMLIARKHQVGAVFVPNPFNEQRGLFDVDGSPGALFLPWRTTAGLIAGAEYLGDLNLPGGSSNMLFAKQDRAVLAVWSDRPTTERIYLGDDARQVDLSGRETAPKQVQGEQEFEVGRLPTFIIGVNLPVARWRMSFALEPTQLASVFGRPQSAGLRFRNYFPEGASGTVTLQVPEVWEVSPRQMSFELSGGAENREAFQVVLGAAAASGKQTIRADFDVTADRNYRFSVFRDVEIGLGDVYIELSTALSNRGELVVRQDFVNETDQAIDFNCLLFAPERRRVRKQIIRQRRGRHTTVYRLPEGEELIGKTLMLRAEEINGNRILNYRIVAER